LQYNAHAKPSQAIFCTLDKKMSNTASSMNERFKSEVEKAGYSMKEVASMTGIPVRTLYSAFKPGHSFGTSILDEVGEHIDLDYGYIFTGVHTSAHFSQSLQTSAEDHGLHSSTLTDPEVKFMGETLDPSIVDEFVFVPHYNVSAEAGSGRLIEDAEPRPFPFRSYWIKNKIGTPAEKLMLIRVQGDSMLPTLDTGDTIMIDRSKTYPASDHIYLVRIEDLYRVKRVQKIPGEKLRLTSDNPLYKDIEVDMNNEAVEIIGKVVWRSAMIDKG
jgi:phage repressor protein C with HTH and peptisase S24 domain